MARVLYFKTTFGVNPSDLSIIASALSIAWFLKPFYGIISDCFPFFGYHRKSYLMLSGILGLISYTAVIYSRWLSVSIAALILSELSQSIADVIVDGLMVEKSKIDKVNGANDLQRYTWGCFFIGSMMGTILGGYGLDYIDARYIIACISFSSLLIVCSSVSLDEDRVCYVQGNSEIFFNHMKLFFAAVKNLKILRIVAFVILWEATFLGFQGIFTYYLYDVLFLQPSTVALASLASEAGLLLSTVFKFQSLLQWSLFKKLLIGRILVSSIYVFDILIVAKSYEDLGISYYYFLFGTPLTSRFFIMLLSGLPVLNMFVKITPANIEASFFALLGSAFTIGRSLSNLLVSFIMNITGITSQYDSNVWVLFVISIAVGYASLILLFLIPKDILQEQVMEYQDLEKGNEGGNELETKLISPSFATAIEE